MIAHPGVVKNRWSACSLPANLWPASLRRASKDFATRGFVLSVWRNVKGTFVTVGERIRPGVTSESAMDGTQFSCIWLHAATAPEVEAFWQGMLAGELLVRRAVAR